MIKIENAQTAGWEPAVRGMRNPMNSWEKSDSRFFANPDDEIISYIGPNDLSLMQKLVKAGSDHRKFMRMIVAYMDITAPLYWWKEFETYKVGTVSNSCSTMHKIHEKEFTLKDFSHEHLINSPLVVSDSGDTDLLNMQAVNMFEIIIGVLNAARYNYLKTYDKTYWWQLIQLLPSSYNQRRTVMLNYEVLHNIYAARKDHKLDEWREFCRWIEELPYAAELIVGEVD